MEVTVTRLGETPLLEARGDIDHNTCGSVGSALDEALADGNDIVLLDLRQVTYIDSGGLSVLLSGVRLLRERGWLGVIGPNPNVRRLLEIVGLLVDPNFRVFEEQGGGADGSGRTRWRRDRARDHDFQRVIRVKAETAQLAEIRRFVEEVALEAALDMERVFDLKVAVSEACANAVEHAGCEAVPLEVCARLQAGASPSSSPTPGCSIRPPHLGRASTTGPGPAPHGGAHGRGQLRPRPRRRHEGQPVGAARPRRCRRLPA